MEGDLLSLKWNNHKTTFLHVIENLRNKASYADATIACNEQFFPVHKFVLSACSEYFSAIFEQISCKNPVIILKDIECRNLKYLLDYMYIGEVNVKKNELASLVGTAECLRIKGLAVPDEDAVSNKRLSFDYDENLNPPMKKKKAKRNDLKSLAKRTSYEKVEGESPFSLSESYFENTLYVDSFSNPIKCEPTSDGENVEDNPRSDSDNSLSVNIDGPNTDNIRSRVSDPDFINGDTEELIAKDEPDEPSYDILDQPGPSSIYNNDLTQPAMNTSSKCLEHAAMVDIMSSSQIVSELGSTLNCDENSEQRLIGGNCKDSSFSYLTKNPALEKPSNKDFSKLGLTIVEEDGALIYRCNFCTYITKMKTYAKQHSMIHTGVKSFSCTYCPYKALRKEHLSKHLYVHTGTRPFKCQFCHYRTITKQALQLHLFRRHKSDIGLC